MEAAHFYQHLEREQCLAYSICSIKHVERRNESVTQTTRFLQALEGLSGFKTFHEETRISKE